MAHLSVVLIRSAVRSAGTILYFAVFNTITTTNNTNGWQQPKEILVLLTTVWFLVISYCPFVLAGYFIICIIFAKSELENHTSATINSFTEHLQIKIFHQPKATSSKLNQNVDADVVSFNRQPTTRLIPLHLLPKKRKGVWRSWCTFA